VDRLVTERLGVDHPLARHIGAFLTDLSKGCSQGKLKTRHQWIME
jgi:hypothetical protein